MNLRIYPNLENDILSQGIWIYKYLIGYTDLRMKEKVGNRTFIAWVLLMTLAPFFIVKATHYHTEHAHTCQSENGQSHNADKCPICHFLLSPFTSVEIFHIHVFLSFLYFRPIYYVYKRLFFIILSYQLRAPPIFYSIL